MSIEDLNILTKNPFFYSGIVQCFLTGYGRPCDIDIVFHILPVILYKDSRSKLLSANKTSTLFSLFGKSTIMEVVESNSISGKASFSGYTTRLHMMEKDTKNALIILVNENKIELGHRIKLLKKLDYRNGPTSAMAWLRSAHYFGVIFSKIDLSDFELFIGGGSNEQLS